MNDAVIFDVDGTLADVSGVRHYVMDDPKRKNFDAFHKAACFFAPANLVVLDAAQEAHARGMAVIVVTSRKERWRYYTTTWLKKWCVPYDMLLMRPENDDRKDVLVKQDILRHIQSLDFHIVHAWDDNPSIVELWIQEGIPVTVVPGWEYEREEVKP